MKCSARALGSVVIVLLGLVRIANAAPVVWTLSPLIFDTGGGGPSLAEGGIASGSFTYDADSNTYPDWSIVISDFGAGFSQGNALATPATSSIDFDTFGFLPPIGPSSFRLSYSSDQALLWLLFESPLSSSGGSVNVRATILDAGNVFYSWYASGTASTEAIPEPVPAALVLGTIAVSVLLLFARQRRSGRVASATRPF